MFPGVLDLSFLFSKWKECSMESKSSEWLGRNKNVYLFLFISSFLGWLYVLDHLWSCCIFLWIVACCCCHYWLYYQRPLNWFHMQPCRPKPSHCLHCVWRMKSCTRVQSSPSFSTFSPFYHSGKGLSLSHKTFSKTHQTHLCISVFDAVEWKCSLCILSLSVFCAQCT